MVISEQTYQLVVIEDTDRQWELWDGQLREKPGMGAEHNDVIAKLGMVIGPQLDWRRYRTRINTTHVRRSERRYYIPDLIVVPTEEFRSQTGHPGQLEIYERPLPLVIEVWSLTTGDYDVDDKLPEYQTRGDLEIWRLHPFERTLTVWRRQPDGSYIVEVFHGGIVRALSLPKVIVDLDLLFDFE